MKKKRTKFYENTWFCIIVYIIFFPLGLFLALRSSKVSKDMKNLLKVVTVVVIFIYVYFAGNYLKLFIGNEQKDADVSVSTEIVNKEEFKSQGDITIKNIEGLLKKYKADVSHEEVNENIKNEEGTEEGESAKGNNAVASAGNRVKVSGDPYEYNVSYKTEDDEDKGKVNLLIAVKYPKECILNFKNSNFMKEILTAFEGDNVDFNSFNSWVEKCDENYSGKKVINSSVYSRNISNVEETLNFNTGKEGIMQVNLIKNVKVE